MRRKRIWLAALLLLALAVLLPSVLRLGVLQRPLRAALERHLGRPVEFRALTARLLPRPGVVARDVLLHAQEGFGAEPVLYAEEVSCALPAAALWRWRMDCVQLSFLRPSINLVRTDEGRWNIGGLLLEGLAGENDGEGAAASRPLLSGTGGRINFKLGTDKLVYTLADFRFRMEPQAGGGWEVQADATPRRTDRRLSETGRLRVQGEVESARGSDSLRFRIEAGLDHGSLAQLAALVFGREPGIRAEASLAVGLKGTPAAWSARGTLTLANFRRWDLLPSARTPRWESEFSLTGEDGWNSIQVEGITVRAQQSEIRFTGALEDPFGRRRWDLEVKSGRLVLDELLGQFASLRSNVPDETRLEGVARLDLAVRGRVPSWQGKIISADPILLHIPGRDEPLPLTGLNLELNRANLELHPLIMEFSPETALAVSGTWQLATAPFPYRVRWQSEGVQLSSLEQVATALGWSFSGSYRWESKAALDLEWIGDAPSGWAAQWRGRLELREAKFFRPAFNHPVSIPQADLAWTRRGLRIDPLVLRLGENQSIATLQRRSRDGRWFVNATAARLRLGVLDELLNPSRRSLLARLVQPGRSPQQKWDLLSLDATLRVDELHAGPFRLRRVRTQAQWREGELSLSGLRFRAYGGRFDGRLQGDFLSDPPKYRLVGNLRQMNVNDLLVDTSDLGELLTGLAGADVVLEAAGTRTSHFINSLEGRIMGVLRDGEMKQLDLLAAMAVAAGPEHSGEAADGTTRLQSLAGDFRIVGRQVELDEARIIVEGAALELTGRVGFGGGLDLELRGEPLRVAGRRPTPAARRLLAPVYRVTGNLRRPQVQLASPEPTAGDSP